MKKRQWFLLGFIGTAAGVVAKLLRGRSEDASRGVLDDADEPQET